MARYIDADMLLEELQEEIDFKSPLFTKEQSEWFNKGLRCAFRDVMHQPTADVVEVVRCSECVHWQPFKEDKISKGVCYCEECGNCMSYTRPTDFCSYGERSDK